MTADRASTATEARRARIKGSVWFALNVLGMAAYLVMASRLWNPGDEGLPPGHAYFWAGDAFYWFFDVLPILAAFALFDLGSLLVMLLRTPRRRRLKALALWCAVVALWMVTFAIDVFMHRRIVYHA